MPRTRNMKITRFEDIEGWQLARELTRQVFDIKSAMPASMFADSPHMTKAELEELDAILNADQNNDGKDGQ